MRFFASVRKGVARPGCRKRSIQCSAARRDRKVRGTRDTGEADKLTLSDLRLFLGIEGVRTGGAGRFLEVGYVFNRSIEYSNNDEEFDFGDAVMLRGGIRF